VSDLEIVALPNGQLSQNCYLLADRQSGEAVMVDPGEEPRLFLAELDTRGWALRGIWLTHAHVDHIMGVAEVKAATGVPIHLHPADRGLYDALPRQGEWMGLALAVPPPPEEELADGQRLQVGGQEFTPHAGSFAGQRELRGPGLRPGRRRAVQRFRRPD